MSGSSAPSPIVIDASALVELLLVTARSPLITRAIRDAPLLAPDLVNPEVAQCLRNLERGGKLSEDRAARALERLGEGAVSCVPTAPLLTQAWSLRHNLSAYDACYVALARTLRCSLLTADGPLARAPRLGVALIIV
jgi:predicted nucleic acid-binding protein